MKLRIFAVAVALTLTTNLLAQTLTPHNSIPGTVVGWGDYVIPYIAPGTRFTAIAAGGDTFLALKPNGTVLSWGGNDDGSCMVPVNLANVIAISTGGYHSLTLKSDGTVVAWGAGSLNSSNFLDWGQSIVPTGLSNVVAIAAGAFHSLALKSDGTVIAWGAGLTNAPSSPNFGQSIVPTALNNVVAISASGLHSLALKSNGAVIAWGQLWNGSAQGPETVPADLTNVVAIAAGDDHSLALKGDGTVVAWGANSSYNGYTGQSVVPAGLSNVMAIAAGGAHSLALKSNGTVVAWGDNSSGQISVPTGLSKVVAIAAGPDDSLALKSDGTIIAWGNTSCDPQSIVPVESLAVIAIAAGNDQNLELKTDGTVVAAPVGGAPVPGNLNNVVAIAAGGQHDLALKNDGTVAAWGDNQNGESTVPNGLNNIVAIAAGEFHSLALKSDGTVAAWGAGLTNNSSDDDYGQSIVPIGLTGVVAIAAGEYHSLALKGDGTVVAWGANDHGECSVPRNLANVSAIAGGWAHSLALTSDGRVVGWGDNEYGESSAPEGLTNVVAIAAGGTHSIAFKADGSVVAWGWGYYYDGEGTWPAELENVIAISGGDWNTLALVSEGAQKPTVLGQPNSQVAQTGASVMFSVFVAGTPLLKYQWQFNGQNIPGQTAAGLSLSNVQFANAGGYSVIVSNAYGSVTSAVAQLTVFTNLVVAQTNQPPPPPGKPTIPTDTTHFKVFTNGGFVSGIGLDRSKSTIVLTHGLNESSLNYTDWPQEMANFIKLELGSGTPNMVAWDWTAQAAGPLPAATLDTQGQGYALGETLTNTLGTTYSQRIHFIGHSLGTLVNAKAANFIHTNGFAWSNTQMTLLDEAEVAWGTVEDTWQTATSLLQNDSAPQQDWKHPLPDQCAWADNYITAVGMPHPQAVNVILTNLVPDYSNIQNNLDLIIVAGAEVLKWTDQFQTEDTDYHNYPYIWYENTVNQINNPNDPPYPMGFVRSWEGGGYAGRPAANTYYMESSICPPSFASYPGYDPAYNLVQITPDQANQYLNARPQNLISQVGVNLGSWSANILANNNNQQVQLLDGPAVSASSLITGPANPFNMVVATVIKLITTSAINGLVRPMGGPVPRGGSPTNSPAYVWIPVTVPSNALTMAFNFMVQGDGKQDSLQVALNSNDLMTVEMVLFPTNVTMSSGMIDVSQYAGQQAELFFGIVGGTSTNASVTISGIAFYVTLPPSLQIQLAGTNVVVTWPLSAAGYVLETTDKLRATNLWAAVTNVPVIVNFQYTVANPVSGGSRFYRLARTSTVAPALQARMSGNSIVLAWPASWQNLSLQTTTNVAAANSWTAVTNIPAVLNQQNVLTNAMSGRMRFYRLKVE